MAGRSVVFAFLYISYVYARKFNFHVVVLKKRDIVNTKYASSQSTEREVSHIRDLGFALVLGSQIWHEKPSMITEVVKINPIAVIFTTNEPHTIISVIVSRQVCYVTKI